MDTTIDVTREAENLLPIRVDLGHSTSLWFTVDAARDLAAKLLATTSPNNQLGE